jgi:serine/threonine protein kinase
VTTKVDVYSFGVVLLELITGRVANQAGENGHLATWARRHGDRLIENPRGFSDIIDKSIPDRPRFLKEMAAMFQLGVDCTVMDPLERPVMSKVVSRFRSRGY